MEQLKWELDELDHLQDNGQRLFLFSAWSCQHKVAGLQNEKPPVELVLDHRLKTNYASDVCLSVVRAEET
jgi:hypothetical protein